MSLPAASQFGHCPCGGTYERRNVEIPIARPSGVLTLDNIPQGACPTCGSRVYKAGTLEAVEAVMGGRPIPR